jgi:hypothetical protein
MKSFENFLNEELRKLSMSEAKPEVKLLTLKGDDYETASYYDKNIISLMKSKMNIESRNYISDLIEATKGKKVLFYNTKDGQSIKKERISLGGYWKKDQFSIDGWQFMLKGTKKDYVVNMFNHIGYYDKATKISKKYEPKTTVKWYKGGGKFGDEEEWL